MASALSRFSTFGLPHGAVLRRAAHAVRRRAIAVHARRRDRTRPTYAEAAPDGPLNVVCAPVPRDRLIGHEPWIRRAAALFCEHRFELLGSGWIRVRHGAACSGFDGTHYPPAPRVTADRDGRWLSGRINPANEAESRCVWQLVDDGYVPLDWQLDVRSGYRWRENCWAQDVPFGRLDGVDIKVPWELARMQHLVLLAWAHRLGDGDGDRLIRECRNQILDFIAANPPRFGVNWRCAMDVAIRAANWVMAYGLFRAHGAVFDGAFEDRLKRSLIDHGRHIANNLEIYPSGRGNHYLADICGLLFIAACLPPDNETDGWLALAVQELTRETAYQFHPDGTNFEGSTFYHRLSTEMIAYATALVMGLPAARLSTLDRGTGPRTRPQRALEAPVALPASTHFARLERAAEFIADLTKPGGHIPQIGDNDSGRFLKPHPVYGSGTGHPAEDMLDQRGTLAALAAVTGRDDLLRMAGTDRLDGALAVALSHGRQRCGEIEPFVSAHVRVGDPVTFRATLEAAAKLTVIIVPGDGLRRGLTLRGYPDFGLWIFRSDRLFLAVRCGATSDRRAGGSHAHNDQLAIELAVDDEDWIADPGSYQYCPPIERRNAWRSVQAHSAPHWAKREPASLGRGLFHLANETQARCLHFGDEGFAGEHRGFPAKVCRSVVIEDDRITIRDAGLPNPGETVRCIGRAATRRHFATAVPFSPGYGCRSGREDTA